jgi:hypothetical protein
MHATYDHSQIQQYQMNKELKMGIHSIKKKIFESIKFTWWGILQESSSRSLKLHLQTLCSTLTKTPRKYKLIEASNTTKQFFIFFHTTEKIHEHKKWHACFWDAIHRDFFYGSVWFISDAVLDPVLRKRVGFLSM